MWMCGVADTYDHNLYIAVHSNGSGDVLKYYNHLHDYVVLVLTNDDVASVKKQRIYMKACGRLGKRTVDTPQNIV
jgi:hypothetical protein